MSATSRTSPHADVLVLGGGVAGCVLASRLTENPDRRVVLVEAGEDYGADHLGWPVSLRTAETLPRDHVWEMHAPAHRIRGRVLGGSSAVNGCWHTWGSAADHRRWEATAGTAFSLPALASHRDRAIATMGLASVDPADITPWGLGALDAAASFGFPVVDMAAPGPPGRGTPLVNAAHGLRRNVALAYLDEQVRRRPNLAVMSRLLVDRLVVTGDRVRAVRVLGAEGARTLHADHVVLSCGAIGSPAVLQRSGIGDAAMLRALGVTPVLELAGVGRNLSDHPGSFLSLAPAPELNSALAAVELRGPLYSTRVLLRAASAGAPADGWDLHLVPVAGRPLFGKVRDGEYEAGISVQLMAPASRGEVSIRSLDPAAPVHVDPGFLSDPDGGDAVVLREGLALAKDLANTRDVRSWWRDSRSVGDLSDAALRASLGCYWHPVGTCAAGDDDDPFAVVDPALRLRGLANVHVVDASVLPTVPAANTQLTVLAVAESAARSMALV